MDAPLPRLTRRHLLSLMGATGGAILLGCSGDDADPAAATAASSTGSTAGSTSSTASAAGASSTAAASSTVTGATTAATATTAAGAATTSVEACAAGETPGETGGPFPADGTNQNGAGALADVLGDPRTVRRDIRSDLDGSHTQEGVPLTLRMRVVEAAACTALAGAAVYVWHCSKDGTYSVYNAGMNGGDYSDRTFLRGVQITDADGWVTFSTVLPGRYQGRAFHIHFEVFGSSDLSQANNLLTSQIALDDAVIDALYRQVGYTEAAGSVTHNDDDNVFRDGVDRQLMSLSGDATSGLVGSIVVGL